MNWNETRKTTEFLYYLYRLYVMVAGRLEPIPSDFVRGTPWTGQQFIAGLIQKRTTTHTCETPVGNLD